MFDVFGFILIIFNIVLFAGFFLNGIIWIAKHEGGVSCFFVPPILLVISLVSCLVSIWVHSKI